MVEIFKGRVQPYISSVERSGGEAFCSPSATSRGVVGKRGMECRCTIFEEGEDVSAGGDGVNSARDGLSVAIATINRTVHSFRLILLASQTLQGI